MFDLKRFQNRIFLFCQFYFPRGLIGYFVCRFCLIFFCISCFFEKFASLLSHINFTIVILLIKLFSCSSTNRWLIFTSRCKRSRWVWSKSCGISKIRARRFFKILSRRSTIFGRSCAKSRWPYTRGVWWWSRILLEIQCRKNFEEWRTTRRAIFATSLSTGTTWTLWNTPSKFLVIWRTIYERSERLFIIETRSVSKQRKNKTANSLATSLRIVFDVCMC